jgi:SdrD B-like domain
MRFGRNKNDGCHRELERAWPVVIQVIGLVLWTWFAASSLRAAVMPSLASTSGATALGTAALSWSHTIGSGQNRVLLVALHIEDEGSAGSLATAITWTVGGVPQSLTLIPATGSLRSGEIGLQLWGLVAPAVGTGTIAVAKSSFSGDVFVGRAWNLVDARQALDGTIVSAVGNESAPSITIGSKTNHLMMGLVSVAKYTWTNAPTQTLQYADVVEDQLGLGLTINDAEGVWFGGATINGTGANVSFRWGTTAPALTGSAWVTIGYAVQSASYVLGGTVWRDNGSPGADDGTQGAGESGIANVTVELRNPHPLSGPADPLLATTTTDATGNYRFTDLDPGSYLVLVRATNFTTGPLVGLYSSGTAADLYNTSSLTTDGTDDGLNAQYPARTGVQSDPVVLGSADSLALDFGFASPAPTAVGLAYFHVTRVEDGWEFEWRTLWEEACLGFDLVVVEDGLERELNAEMMPSPGDGQGHVYRLRLGASLVPEVELVFLRETELDGALRYYGTPRQPGMARGSAPSMVGADRLLVLWADPGNEVEILWAERVDAEEWRTFGTGFADSAGRVVIEDPQMAKTPTRFFRVRSF